MTRLECTQVVPLLSSSPDQLILVVSRRPAPMFDEMDELIDVEEGEAHQNHISESNRWTPTMNTTISNGDHVTSSNQTTPTTPTSASITATNTNNSSPNTFTLLSQSKTSTV